MHARNFVAARSAVRPGNIGAALVTLLREASRKARALLYASINRRIVRKLEEMSDWQLADIGLVREDLRFCLSMPLGVDPSTEIARRARCNINRDGL